MSLKEITGVLKDNPQEAKFSLFMDRTEQNQDDYELPYESMT